MLGFATCSFRAEEMNGSRRFFGVNCLKTWRSIMVSIETIGQEDNIPLLESGRWYHG